MSNQERLFLALTAIKLRCLDSPVGLAAEIIKIVDDAQYGIRLEQTAQPVYSTIHVDGEPAFEASIRTIPKDES